MPGPKPTPPAERLLRFVVVGEPDACWPFTGSTDDGGYGRLNVGGRPVPAHRIAWEAEHGPVPDGLWVLHTCDNPPCCNARHLFLGTHDDNMADAASKHRMRGGTSRGEANARAKLTDVQVAEVRALYSSGMAQRLIAAQFGITQPAVSSIVTGRTRSDR